MMDVSLAAINMVSSLKIANFRGFPILNMDGLAKINVIVGENAAGKTALLEALYLALSGNSQQPFILKTWRGLNPSFIAGSADSVAVAFYEDLFNNGNSKVPITIEIKGIGVENRKLTIVRTSGAVASVESSENRKQRRASGRRKAPVYQTVSQVSPVPISLTWEDQNGVDHTTRALLSGGGLAFEGTNEVLENCFLYASMNPVPQQEAASFFGELKKKKKADPFKKIFKSVFPNINDIEIGEVGNVPVLMADVPWASELIPLPLVSGGTNRVAAILLSITYRENGLVMVDEVEGGVFHSRQKQFSEALIRLAREYKTQLFLTTHSSEWIKNFFDAAGGSVSDIAFWRLERGLDGVPVAVQFSADETIDGIEYGEDVRGR